MKYLKTFENINEPEFKKYFVIKSHNKIQETYFVLEFVKIDEDSTVYTNKLYTYNLNEDELKRNKDQFYRFNNTDEIRNNVIYQTDDLKNAIDVVKSLNRVNTYNL